MPVRLLALFFDYIHKHKQWSIVHCQGKVSKSLKKMLIGELVKRTGLRRDTIRFYEKHGLIQVGRKERRNNNYKEYSEEILDRLLNVKHLKSFGFTLNECADVLDMIEANEATCQNLEGKIREKINLLQQKIDELEQVKSTLIHKVASCGNLCSPTRDESNCPIVVSERTSGF